MFNGVSGYDTAKANETAHPSATGSSQASGSVVRGGVGASSGGLGSSQATFDRFGDARLGDASFADLVLHRDRVTAPAVADRPVGTIQAGGAHLPEPSSPDDFQRFLGTLPTIVGHRGGSPFVPTETAAPHLRVTSGRTTVPSTRIGFAPASDAAAGAVFAQPAVQATAAKPPLAPRARAAKAPRRPGSDDEYVPTVERKRARTTSAPSSRGAAGASVAAAPATRAAIESAPRPAAVLPYASEADQAELRRSIRFDEQYVKPSIMEGLRRAAGTNDVRRLTEHAELLKLCEDSIAERRTFLR